MGRGVLDSVKVPLVPSVQKHNFLFVYDAVLSGRRIHIIMPVHTFISPAILLFHLHSTMSIASLLSSSGYTSIPF
jgi:hypothetical protein